MEAIHETVFKEQNKKSFVQESKDPFRVEEHWRAKFKTYNECCICGAIEKIALHHTNSVCSTKNVCRHSIARAQIHRLQIPVCGKCHLEIAHGKYNNIRFPVEFYGEFLAKLLL